MPGARDAWLVLDVDDTLVATFRTGYAKFVDVARSLGLERPSLALFTELYGRMTFEECVQRLHPDVDVGRYGEAYDALAARHPPVPLCDGRSLMAAAARAGVRCGILTNGPAAKTVPKMQACGLDLKEFEFVITGDTAPVRKPHVAAFTAMSAYGVKPERAWYVSDSAPEWRAAESAGLRSVGVWTGLPVSTGFVPTLLVRSTAALPAVVPILAASTRSPRAAAPLAVTFDAGFTLIEPVREPAVLIGQYLAGAGRTPSLSTVRAALASAAEALAAPESWWTGVATAELTLRGFYERVLASLGHRSPSAAVDILNGYTNPANWRAVPGARELLIAARAGGYRVGVLSNWQPSLVDVLAAAGLDRYIDAVVTSTTAGAAKPSGAAFHAVAGSLRVPVDRVVHVGDKLVDDVLGALLAGSRAVLVDGPLAGLVEFFRRAAPAHGDGQRTARSATASRSSRFGQ